MNNKIVEENITPLQRFTKILTDRLTETRMTVDEVKGIATVSGKLDGKQFSFFIEQRDCDEMLCTDNGNGYLRKSDRREEVKRLYGNGLTQKEIAFRLNMSQSLVSKLLNSD